MGATTCPRCGTPVAVSGRRRYCSDACRQASYRARRHESASVPVPAVAGVDSTIYECPTCAQRYLGSRRCDDCNRWCGRIGPGGLCPHCDEPVAHQDLSS
ncbi:MAG: hypothetical protein ACREN7_09130 [Candidatus Dormibacteria bacterium]